MKDDNKVQATDTLKNMGTDAKNAMKKDYDQTKADMANMKDKAVGEKDKMEMEGKEKMKDMDEEM